MAGGDVLFILAFIVLPTVVLVSCVWALVLLRKGVLLPERSVRSQAGADLVEQYDPDVLPDDAIETTGEHTIIPVPPAAATTPVVAPAASQPVTVAPVAPAASADVPPIQNTQEFEPVVASAVDPVTPVVAPKPDVQPRDTTPVAPPDQRVVESVPPAAPTVADMLIVPLDETSAPVSRGAQAATTDSTPNGVPPEQSPAVQPRRPARRVGSVRPVDESDARPRPRVGQRRQPRSGDEG